MKRTYLAISIALVGFVAVVVTRSAFLQGGGEPIHQGNQVRPGVPSGGPAGTERAATRSTPIPIDETEARLSLSGLRHLYTTEELAFTHDDLAGRLADCLSAMGQGSMLGLARLEVLLSGLSDASQLEELAVLLEQHYMAAGEDGIPALRMVFRLWGRLDGERAFAFAQGRSSQSGEWSAALVEAVRSWTGIDPEAAGIAVAGMPDSTSKGGALARVAEVMASESPEKAVDWAWDIAEPYRGNTLRQTMLQWVNEDAEAALGYVAALASDPDWGDGSSAVLVSEAVGYLSGIGGADAARWAETLPAGRVRKEAYVALIADWAAEDPEAASGWVADLPPSLETDAVIGRFARSAVWTDPETAVAWVETIGDRNIRDSSLRRVLASWGEIDRGAATAWAQRSGNAALLEEI